MLGLGVVVAVENQILHNLLVGLRRGAPVQPDGGRCQGAQAQVRWGCRGPWVSGEEMGEAGSLRKFHSQGQGTERLSKTMDGEEQRIALPLFHNSL